MRAKRGPGDPSLTSVSTLPLPQPARGLEFLMILGTESYTSFPMVPKGMFYNPNKNLLLIWGNFLLQRCGAGPVYSASGPIRVGALSGVLRFSEHAQVQKLSEL